MKRIAVLLMFLPLAAMAGGPPQFGLSGKVTSTEREHQIGAATQSALEQQRLSPPAQKSALSLPIYIDTQRRLADSFKHPIPESFGEQTLDEE